MRGWVAEIIVALNGTTDDSAAIARAHGALVHELPWAGYRDTKNAALDLATHAWALCLDADEEVSPALRQSIHAFFTSGMGGRDGRGGSAAAAGEVGRAGGFVGARFPRKVWFINRWITHGDWYPDLSLRLVLRAKSRWGGDAFVHEKMVCDGPVATLRGDLHHYSFPTLASHVDKITPFAALFLKQQRARGRRFSLLAALTRPAWRFIRAYFLRRGFLDGYPGLYIAWATAFGAFVRYSTLYENETRKEPPDAE